MSAKAPIKFLRIKQFRGSTKDFSINFDPTKSLTLIYGENGSGKTTICDAFDFLGNGKVGSLESRGLGPIHPFWPTIGKSSADILVELMVDGTTWNAQASAKSVIVSPNTILPPKIEILRRSSILGLVQNAPKEKYDALLPFIDISNIEQAEAALRNQIKASKSIQSDAANRIAENEETLQRLRIQSGAVESNTANWAAGVLEIQPEDPAPVVKALKDAVMAIEALKSIKALAAAAVNESNEATSTVISAEQALVSAEAEAMSSDAAFEQILSAAKDHFDKHTTDSICPLCESADRIDGLAGRVSERLEKLKQLSSARRTVVVAKASENAKKTILVDYKKKASDLAAAALTKVESAPKDWTDSFVEVMDAISTIKSSGELSVLNPEEFSKACEAANGLCSALESKSSWYMTVKTVYEQYQTNIDSQKVISQVLPKLEQALVIIESNRKRFLDTILSDIAQEVGRLYEQIHPGEGLNKITLKLDPKRAGSLDLAAEFLSKQDQPPHAYFSESHLDSLGLCIFLALSALKNPELTIIVMDDVIGSIDEPHVDRLIGMLYAESKKFKHTIVTTHYQPWREKFRWGWLKNGQCELIELGNWEPVNGIANARLSHAPLFELRQHLFASPPLLASACGSAGIMLEAICDYLVSRYDIDVPRRKLTLGDLLPRVAEKKKLIDSLRVAAKQLDGTYVDTRLGNKLIQLREMAQLRNIFGCHYNELANSMPQKDALEFATLVHEIGAALICDDEGWPGSDKSGEYWATRNETRRLYPLKKPQ